MDPNAINWNNVTLATGAVAAVIWLWRAYTSAVADHIKDLREFNTQKLYDITARVMVIEDKFEIDRQDRFKYMPPVTMAERKATGNLDLKESKFSDEISASRKT